jgi:hypothetical protein
MQVHSAIISPGEVSGLREALKAEGWKREEVAARMLKEPDARADLGYSSYLGSGFAQVPLGRNGN